MFPKSKIYVFTIPIAIFISSVIIGLQSYSINIAEDKITQKIHTPIVSIDNTLSISPIKNLRVGEVKSRCFEILVKGAMTRDRMEININPISSKDNNWARKAVNLEIYEHILDKEIKNNKKCVKNLNSSISSKNIIKTTLEKNSEYSEMIYENKIKAYQQKKVLYEIKIHLDDSQIDKELLYKNSPALSYNINFALKHEK